MTDNVTPTQADRDTAESILGEMAMGNEKRAQLVAARHRLDTLATQAAEIARLRDALEFYAKDHVWPNEGPWGAGSDDFGLVARAALSTLNLG